MNILKTIILACLLTTGCAQKAQIKNPDFENSVIVMNSNLGVVRTSTGFQLNYVNNLEQDVCIDKGDWPNKNGQVHYAREIYNIRSGQDILPIQDRNLGYCTHDCFFRIVPEAKIDAFIPDSEFDQNGNKYHFKENDVLSTNLIAHRC